ncbi:hypothetical protein TNCV_761711 [Trichonephila clavipes]|nr:hypothetical protein TNCV_761711 [Trichonephila clavipes]
MKHDYSLQHLINLPPLSTEIQPSVPLPHSAATTSNSEPSDVSKIPKNAKQNSRNRRKRTKIQKPQIEIKMAAHKPRKSAPMEYTTDDEDMLMYDVKEEELEPDPTEKFAIKECFIKKFEKYIRALIPT